VKLSADPAYACCVVRSLRHSGGAGGTWLYQHARTCSRVRSPVVLRRYPFDAGVAAQREWHPRSLAAQLRAR
jgi:hypothetical protein